MKTKRCPRCGITKDVSDFRNNSNYKNGLSSWCRECEKASSIAYYNSHKESVKKTGLLYRQKNRKEISAKQKARDDANRERKREMDRRYAATHRQQAIDRAKAWYIANKEKVAEWGRNYRKKNAEKVKAKKAEYSRTHQIERNALEHKREVKKKGNGGTYTKQQFIDLCRKYDNRCLMCKRNDVKLTVDHVVPVALGGSNHIENIQPLCLSCNSKKHTTILDLR